MRLARLQFTTSRERPVASVPRGIRMALVAAALCQAGLSAVQPAPAARAQAYDNQPGISIPFLDLDYAHVEQWLQRILQLDPRGQYPLLMAAQVYAQVPDAAKQRRMLEFAYRSFSEDPDRRWPWLAHAAIMAKHRLQDPQLALRYAKALREQARGSDVPGWAKQMEIFLREDVGEFEAARALLGGLLHSGTISDAHEQHFLIQRLGEIEAAEKSSAASKTRLPGPGPRPDSANP